MARAIELPRFSGTRRVDKQPDERSEQWLPVRSIESPPWLKAVFDDLNSVGALNRNWDSYGAEPVRAEIISLAKTLLSKLDLETHPQPSVSAVPGGGIGLHWRVAERDLEIEITGNGTKAFLRTDLTNPTGNSEGDIPSLEAAQRIINWVILG